MGTKPGRLAALLLGAIPSLTLCGQNADLAPQIRQELAAATNDTARADALARLCFNLSRTAPDSALQAGEAAMAIATRIKQPKALGDAYNNLGWLAVEQGQFRRADSLLAQALVIFNATGKPQYTAVVLSNLGWLAEKKGDETMALRRFQEAYQASELAKDSASMAAELYALGVTSRKLKDHAKAMEYLGNSLAMEFALQRPFNQANCLLAMANTAREQGDTARVMLLYEQAAVLYRRIGDHAGAGLVEENIGDFRMERSPAEALAHYRTALVQYDSIGSDVDRAYVLKNIGTAETILGQLASAQASLGRGFALARGMGAAQLVMEYELALARLAAALGNASATRAHYERYGALKDSLQGADTQRELARLRTTFDTERKESDNALLRLENSAQEERLHNRGRLLLGSVVLALLAIISALLFRRNYRQKRKHANVLEQFNAQLESSNAEIKEINGLLEMRLLRSQMNPHFIYNGLNRAARMTQEGRAAEALAYLQGFARLLRMVLEYSVKDQVDIQEEMDFLRQYLKLEARRLPGLNYSVEADRSLIDGDNALPALLVQPFVENAVWHGLSGKQGERSVLVRFSQDLHGIRCVITDNGVGRKAAGTNHNGQASLGMQLTGERLKLLTRRLGHERSMQVEDLTDAGGAPVGTRITLHLSRPPEKPLDRAILPT
ncbi:MAG: histidine kinase [Flavobacteriales bacterium]|nr:histidine kinase [Flavobacteriales bacterium]MBP9079342.1 histidine kinase [Flavobacteriales bacterium]